MSLAHWSWLLTAVTLGFKARPVHCLSHQGVRAPSLVGPEIHSLNFFSFPNTRCSILGSWGLLVWVWIPNSEVCPCWSLTPHYWILEQKFCRRCFLFFLPQEAELVLSMRTWSSEPGRLEDLAENLWPLEPSAAPSPQYLVSQTDRRRPW